ncbi:MAG: pyrrolysine--tRNA(Pyl) ligase large subunit [Candidatus Aminicenantes bacterium]|nr:pyrrolysine--tRNA(Pyl) ligase large subunit [Candidatus Aminicenantes bacterium]
MNEKLSWTVTQSQRLRELNAPQHMHDHLFSSEKERNESFLELERTYVRKSRQQLRKLRDERRRPKLCALEDTLAQALIKIGFVQVVTPILISKSSLDKMSIRPGHKLSKQVFWLGGKKCLRPMLAPNLYHLLQELVKIWEKPVRIFEVGPCFRKDSGGRYHVNEFTMLNLVELGLPQGKGRTRLEELVSVIMDASGIKDYKSVPHKSEVYGTTIDFVSEFELASGVVGPHALDSRWGINDPWVGVGFGLERLLMVREHYRNVQRAGRTLIYLDGERLNV